MIPWACMPGLRIGCKKPLSLLCLESDTTFSITFICGLEVGSTSIAGLKPAFADSRHHGPGNKTSKRAPFFKLSVQGIAPFTCALYPVQALGQVCTGTGIDCKQQCCHSFCCSSFPAFCCMEFHASAISRQSEVPRRSLERAVE